MVDQSTDMDSFQSAALAHAATQCEILKPQGNRSKWIEQIESEFNTECSSCQDKNMTDDQKENISHDVMNG